MRDLATVRCSLSGPQYPAARVHRHASVFRVHRHASHPPAASLGGGTTARSWESPALQPPSNLSDGPVGSAVLTRAPVSHPLYRTGCCGPRTERPLWFNISAPADPDPTSPWPGRLASLVWQAASRAGGRIPEVRVLPCAGQEGAQAGLLRFPEGPEPRLRLGATQSRGSPGRQVFLSDLESTIARPSPAPPGSSTS